MPAHPENKDPKAWTRRWPEYGLAAFFLVSFLIMLLCNYSMKAWSDPVHWFVFGSDFPSRFADENLAYGFPLVIFAATRVLDPYHAFLVNMPILVALLGVFALFVRTSLAGERRQAWLTGLVAACLFVMISRDLLVDLVSPYRDPLAFLSMLLAALLFVLHFESSKPRWAALAFSGLGLAYAVSCRETSGLLALPMGAYALSARRSNLGLSLVKELSWFGLFLFAGCLPWLAQNFLASGNPIVPAQGAVKVEEAGSLSGLIPTYHAKPAMLPTAVYLWRHYGPAGILAAAVGLVAAWRQGVRPLYALCFPAIVVFFLFYMLYHKVVPRYLLVMDLFLLPLAAFGVMQTLRAVTCRLRPRNRDLIAWSLATAFVLSIGGWMLTTRLPHQRFLPGDARALVETIDARFPRKTRLACERPLEGILLCFSHTRARALRDMGRHTTKWETIRFFSAKRTVYLASLSSSFRQDIEREFDLDEELVLDLADFHLDEWFHAPELHVARVVPWSATNVTTTLTGLGNTEIHDHLIQADLGHLSTYPREETRVYLGDLLLDVAPLDDLNFYPIPSLPAEPVPMLRVASDGPLPRTIPARVVTWSESMVLNFRDEELVSWQEPRLQAGWITHRRENYPSVDTEGEVVFPTPGGGAWAAALQMKGTKPATVSVVTRDGVVRGSATIQADHWSQVPVYLPRGITAGINTIAEVAVDQAGGKPRRVWLRRVALRPLDGARGTSVDVGVSPNDLVHVARGFYHAESGDGGRYRWTGGEADAHLFLPRVDRETVVRVAYRDPRPAAVPPADLTLVLNGEQLQADGVEEENEWTIWSAVVPAAGLRVGVNELTLSARTWVPAEVMEKNRDTRTLGVQVHRIDLEAKSVP